MNFSHYKNFNTYLGKNILSIDYGTKIVGLAFFCPGLDPVPYPHSNISYKNDRLLIEKIATIVEEEIVQVIVLGIPFLTDGKETAMTIKVRNFGKLLKGHFANLEVYFQDETLSTFEAGERMKNSPRYNFKVNSQSIDMVAATIILEDFLRSESSPLS